MRPATLLLLILLTATPTLLGLAVIHAPRWCAALTQALADRRRRPEDEPLGPPIERLARDLRRLLRLHDELSVSAHVGLQAHRLWAVEDAIWMRAREAALALDVPLPSTGPGNAERAELAALLRALAAAGLVLPTRVGPFTRDGRL